MGISEKNRETSVWGFACYRISYMCGKIRGSYTAGVEVFRNGVNIVRYQFNPRIDVKVSNPCIASRR